MRSSEKLPNRLRWTTKLVHKLEMPSSPIQCLEWSSVTADLVGFGHEDGSVSIYGASDGQVHIQIPARHQRTCSSIKFNSANLLAIGLGKVRNDASLTIYDVQASSPFSLFANSEAVSSLAWVPDDSYSIIAGLNYRWLRLIDIRMDPREVSAALSIPTKAVYQISVDANDTNCFASTFDDNVLIWDRRMLAAPTMSLKTSTGSNESRVHTLRFAPDRRGHLASMSDNGNLDIWQLHSPESDQEEYRVFKHRTSKSKSVRLLHGLTIDRDRRHCRGI